MSSGFNHSGPSFRARWPGLFMALLISTPAVAANRYIEPVMVNIPGGQITLQSPLPPPPQDSSSAASSASNAPRLTPPQLVNIKPFRMGKYEVTVKEFSKFIAATHYEVPTQCMQMNNKQWFAKIPGTWQHNTLSSSDYEPVTCIGFPAIQAYVEWLSKETGKHYRLPSEAEWEYAARAGTTTSFYWGDDPAQACSYANVADQEAEAAIKRDYDGLESKGHVGVTPCNDTVGYASIVGSHKPNAFGLHDMIGNINEFTADCYNETFSEKNADGRARTDGDCTKRVLRGGSWHWQPFEANARGGLTQDFIGALEGFRIVEELDSKHPCLKADSRACKKLASNNHFSRTLAKARRSANKKT